MKIQPVTIESVTHHQSSDLVPASTMVDIGILPTSDSNNF